MSVHNPLADAVRQHLEDHLARTRARKALGELSAAISSLYRAGRSADADAASQHQLELARIFQGRNGGGA